MEVEAARDRSEEGCRDFLRLLHRELEDPQYPFALRWRFDGSFQFQTASTLEPMALERLGFKDRDSLFRELHRLGFEQLTMEMTGTSDTSQHRPIFRHPSGRFAPGLSSQLPLIDLASSHDSLPPGPQPIAIPTSTKKRPTVRKRQTDTNSDSYRNAQPDLDSAVSSPMIRSPGLSSSTFSNSTRSFSPLSPPAQFPTPLLSPRHQSPPPLERVPEMDVSEASAIRGLAGLCFEDSQPLDPFLSSTSDTTPRRAPIYVHPEHQLPPCFQSDEIQQSPHFPATEIAVDSSNPLFGHSPTPINATTPISAPRSSPAVETPTVCRKLKKSKRSDSRTSRPRRAPEPSGSRTQPTSALDFLPPSSPLAAPQASHRRSSHLSRSTSTYHPYYPPPTYAAGSYSSSHYYPYHHSHAGGLARSQSSAWDYGSSYTFQPSPPHSLRGFTLSTSVDSSQPATHNYYAAAPREYFYHSSLPRTQRPTSSVRDSETPPSLPDDASNSSPTDRISPPRL